MSRSATCSLLAVTIACGHGAATVDAPHDRAIDASPDASLHDVTLSSFFTSTPAIFQYRDGSGAWQSVPPANADGDSTLEVSNDYEVIAICAGEGSAFIGVTVAATVGDGDQFINCFINPPASVVPTFAVTGTMNQAGSLQIGGTAGSASGATSPWTFSLELPAATYDAAGFDAAKTQMLVRRGLAVGSAGLAVTPAFDLTGEGAALVAPAITIVGAGSGATPLSDTALFTADATFDLGAGSGSSTILAPLSLLQSTDFEELEIGELTATVDQFADMDGEGSGDEAIDVPSTLQMLPVLAGITFTAEANGVQGQWTTLPTAEDVHMILESATQEQHAIASPAWLAVHDATELAFDTSVPGYQSEWVIDLDAPFFAELAITATDAATDVSYSSVFLDPANTPAIRPRSALDLVRERRHRHRAQR
jgi:hypothetical protein